MTNAPGPQRLKRSVFEVTWRDEGRAVRIEFWTTLAVLLVAHAAVFAAGIAVTLLLD